MILLHFRLLTFALLLKLYVIYSYEIYQSTFLELRILSSRIFNETRTLPLFPRLQTTHYMGIFNLSLSLDCNQIILGREN
jgi:hypothetical protein